MCLQEECAVVVAAAAAAGYESATMRKGDALSLDMLHDMKTHLSAVAVGDDELLI